MSWTLCPGCGGSGVTALPGIDVTDIIAEDPDFGDDYRGGFYDEPCPDCHGLRVVPACRCGQPIIEGTWIDFDDDGDETEVAFSGCYEHVSDEERRTVDERAEISAMYEAERRAGA